MLGSAEPWVSPCRIQIGFPSSGKKKKKKKNSSFILTPAFPYNPFSPRLIHGALFRQRFDVYTTWSKRARLDHILVLSSALGLLPAFFITGGNRDGGWRSKWQCTVLWLRCRLAAECHRSTLQARRTDTEWGQGAVVCAGEAQLLFSQHIMLISEVTTFNNGMLSNFQHHLSKGQPCSSVERPPWVSKRPSALLKSKACKALGALFKFYLSNW